MLWRSNNTSILWGKPFPKKNAQITFTTVELGLKKLIMSFITSVMSDANKNISVFPCVFENTCYYLQQLIARG